MNYGMQQPAQPTQPMNYGMQQPMQQPAQPMNYGMAPQQPAQQPAAMNFDFFGM